jgi:hypothetical protein
MLAPVKVLHLPDPGDLATERFGVEQAQELLAVGGSISRAEIIAEVLDAVPPGVGGQAEPVGRQ